MRRFGGSADAWWGRVKTSAVMRCVVVASLAVTTWLSSLGGLAAETGELADYWCEPSLVMIEGCRTFEAADIHYALFRDPEVRRAAHRSAPLDKYLATLKLAVERGYQAEGFSEPRVRINRNLGQARIIVMVEEGRRFTCGSVRIIGCDGDLARELRRVLTNPHLAPVAFREVKVEKLKCDAFGNLHLDEMPRPDKALWQAGVTTRFDDRQRTSIEQDVLETCRAAGYDAPRFRVEVVALDVDAIADLVVTIDELGPRSIVEAIEISGNERDSREAILDLLGATKGMQLTQADIHRMERALWSSGRFASYWVRPKPPKRKDDKFTLQVALREYAEAPPLGQPLSSVGQAALRLRDWLLSPERDNVEFVIRSDDEESPWELIVAPGRGVLAWVGQPGMPSIENFRWAALTTPKRNTLFSSAQFAKLDLPSDECEVTMPVSFQLSKDSAQPFRFVAGLAARPPREGVPQASPLSVILPPSVALALAHQQSDDRPKYEVVEGILIVELGATRLRARAETGEVLGFTLAGLAQGVVVRGVWDERVAQLDRAASAYEPALRPKQPMTSFARFFLEEEEFYVWAVREAERLSPDGDVASVGTEFGMLTRIGRHFLDAGVLAPFEAACYDDGLPKFLIPRPESASSFSPDSFMDWLACYADAIPELIDGMFAPGSWADRFWRELALSLPGRKDFWDEEREHEPKEGRFGPVSCAFLMLTSMDDKQRAGALATAGLGRLSLVEFRRDRRALVDPRGVCGQTLLQCAQALRTLDENDIDPLLKLANLPGLATVIATLREKPEAPLSEALDEALDRAWESEWRELARGAFEAVGKLAATKEAARLPVANGKQEPAPPLGLDGYCPVALLDDKRWELGKPVWTAAHDGRTYRFASKMARDKFVKDRKTYAPVLAGDDVVEWFDNQQHVPGKRKHGVSFEQHIWLFSNEENLARFAKNWEHYERSLDQLPAKQPEGKAEKASTLPPALDGYCPVTLIEQQCWVQGEAKWNADHEGRTYLMSSRVMRDKFLSYPTLYSPVLSGDDAVEWFDNGARVPGVRRYGLFYDSRILLFSSEQSLERFSKNPNHYMKRIEAAEKSGSPKASAPPAADAVSTSATVPPKPQPEIPED